MSKSKTSTTELAVAEPPAATTELTVAQKRNQVLAASRFSALQPDSEVASIIATNYMPGESFRLSDLIKVKVPPGGGSSWTVPELTGDAIYKEITGVMVHYSPSGALWAQDGKAVEGSVPLMVTQDLAQGELLAGPETDWGDLNPEAIEEYRLLDADGTPLSSPAGRPLYDWRNLPYNQWDTGRGGKGKRCRETRRVCILREGDMFPLFIRVPPTSLSNFGALMRKLPTHYYGCVFTLSLEVNTSDGGDKYSKIVPRLATSPVDPSKGWFLTPEEKAAVKATYVDRLGTAMYEADLDTEAAADSEASEDTPF